jgi:hypothetical protein
VEEAALVVLRAGEPDPEAAQGCLLGIAKCGIESQVEMSLGYLAGQRRVEFHDEQNTRETSAAMPVRERLL